MLRKTSNTEILVEHALKYRGDKQWVDYANPWKSCLGTFRFLHFWTQGFEFCLDESWWDGQTSKPTVLWCFDSELLWWLSRKWHRLARVLRVATRICTVLLRFGCWHSVRMRWTDCSIYIYIWFYRFLSANDTVLTGLDGDVEDLYQQNTSGFRFRSLPFAGGWNVSKWTLRASGLMILRWLMNVSFRVPYYVPFYY